MTNYDRIKSMSVEEMAEFIEHSDVFLEESCCENICKCNHKYCDKNICPIYKAPTINQDDLVKHGEWKYDNNNNCWYCSLCDCSALNDYRGASTDSNFCPNCGARMDGGKNDENYR